MLINRSHLSLSDCLRLVQQALRSVGADVPADTRECNTELHQSVQGLLHYLQSSVDQSH